MDLLFLDVSLFGRPGKPEERLLPPANVVAST
jgi:hypothetical protein